MIEQMLMMAMERGLGWFIVALIAFGLWKAAPKLNAHADRLLTHWIESGKARDSAAIAIRESILQHGVDDVKRSAEDREFVFHRFEAMDRTWKEDRHEFANRVTAAIGNVSNDIDCARQEILRRVDGRDDSEDMP